MNGIFWLQLHWLGSGLVQEAAEFRLEFGASE